MALRDEESGKESAAGSEHAAASDQDAPPVADATLSLPVIEAEAPVGPATASSAAASSAAASSAAASSAAASSAAASSAAASSGAAGAKRSRWIRNLAGGSRRPYWKITTAAGAAAAIVIGGVLVIAAAPSTTLAAHKLTHKKKAETVSVVSVVAVSPVNGAAGVNGAAPITVSYSGPVGQDTPMPTVSPRIAGSWQVAGSKAIFTPRVGFTEHTHVTVKIPASAGTTTTAATSFSFTTGEYSVLRLDQLLSQLGYIPVTWTPADASGDVPATDASAQLAAAYDPPAGTFTFDSGYPAALTSKWSVGTSNQIIDGAIRTFEFDHGLTMDGDAGRHVWSRVLTAVAKGEQNQHGYTYVWVTQAGTEHIDVYHNGHLAITTPVNTGIAGRGTADGTFPVYLRYQVTQMTGTNPDGTKYNDTVSWVSYFNGGDAVHAFPRAGYGWYQSLGCVELPSGGSTAEDVWNLITYGTLVTVTGPVA